MMQSVAIPANVGLGISCRRSNKPFSILKTRLCIVRAEPESEGSSSPPQPDKKPPTSAYIDELPEIPRTEMSPEMKARLRKEYYSLGGSPNKAMGNNWFLWISIFIGTLAILSYLTGVL